MRVMVRAAPMLLLAMFAGGNSAAAQTEQGSFVVLRGADTLAVETFTRTPTHLEGALVDRLQFYRQSYSAELAPDARVTQIVLELRRAAEDAKSPPMQHVKLVFQGDSVIGEMGAGADAKSQKFATTEGAIPFMNLGFALTEQALRRAKAQHLSSVPLFVITGGQTFAAAVTPRAADSVTIQVATVALEVASDGVGRILSARVPSQNLIVERIGRTLRASVGTRDYSAPVGAPYMAENVTIPTRAGHTLAGTLTRPRNAHAPVPALVTITGSGSEDRDEALPSILPAYKPFRQIADTLARRGIAVLRLDDRGFGESGGNAATATSADFADDVRAALAWLRARPDIDGARLGLIGHSEGGMIAPLVAATDPHVAALVLLAGPGSTGRAIVRYQNEQAIEQDTAIKPADRPAALVRAMTKVDSSAAQLPWLRYFLDYDPLPTARKVHVPVLILHGGTDWQVLPAQAAQLAAAFRAGGNKDVTVRVFPGVNHLFLRDPVGNPAHYAELKDARVGGDILGLIADWTAAHLAAPASTHAVPGDRP
jgi:dipeptidyl aminopeptidase/acylaminoacyl peptidase